MIEHVIPAINIAEPKEHIADFRHLAKGGGWQKLSPAIKMRFDAMAEGKYTHNYAGNMIVRRSKLGLLFSYICKLFGSPLVADQAESAKVDVSVFQKGEGICWQRVFHFNNKAPITVSSLKVVDSKYGLMERVGSGLNMILEVYEEDGNLHFVSNKYCIKIGSFYMRLPSILTPGRLHVAHIDEGNGAFRFRMSFDHKYFGQTFFQDGVFMSKGGQQ
ncbi:MAG: DUF4166 domain-containing protein [Rickettsiales bacterium]